MNRPKITKQTLKELRGELFAKQSTQKRSEQECKESLLEEEHEDYNDNNSQAEVDFEEEMGME